MTKRRKCPRFSCRMTTRKTVVSSLKQVVWIPISGHCLLASSQCPNTSWRLQIQNRLSKRSMVPIWRNRILRFTRKASWRRLYVSIKLVSSRWPWANLWEVSKLARCAATLLQKNKEQLKRRSSSQSKGQNEKRKKPKRKPWRRKRMLPEESHWQQLSRNNRKRKRKRKRLRRIKRRANRKR